MLGSNNNQKPITIDALVIKKISDIYMAGASNFAKRLEKKGYTLADERLVNCKSDVVVTELLIGADHVDKVISPYKSKQMVLGMWLSFTVFGGALMLGRIPGSSLSPNKNIFHTTVFHINTPIVHLSDSNEEVLAINNEDIAHAQLPPPMPITLNSLKRPASRFYKPACLNMPVKRDDFSQCNQVVGKGNILGKFKQLRAASNRADMVKGINWCNG